MIPPKVGLKFLSFYWQWASSPLGLKMPRAAVGITFLGKTMSQRLKRGLCLLWVSIRANLSQMPYSPFTSHWSELGHTFLPKPSLQKPEIIRIRLDDYIFSPGLELGAAFSEADGSREDHWYPNQIRFS